MKIYYYSTTGNCKAFMRRTGQKNYESIENVTQKVNEPYIIVTGTIRFGEAPEQVLEFIDNNREYLQGVAASGNRNWGPNFAKAADVIAEKYNVPIISKFELRGQDKEVKQFNERIDEFDKRI